MPSESATILIDAEDKASAKLKSVAQAAEANVKQIKTVGGSAKASTELIGTLANQLGSSGIGGFAGELAQLTERISAFSEVSKAGGAGALAFKAGLAGAVGVLSVKLGHALGSAILQTEELNKKFEKNIDLSREMGQSFTSVQESRFSEQLSDLQAIENIEERRAAAQRAVFAIQEAQATRVAQIEQLTEQVAWRTETWRGWAASIYGEYAGHTQILSDQLETAKANSEQAEKQKLQLLQIVASERERQELTRKTAEQATQKAEASRGFVQSLRDELELLRASKAQRFAIEAARGTNNGRDRVEAERLLRERDAIQEKAEAQRRYRAEQEKAREAEKAYAAQRRREAEQEITAKQGIIDAIRRQTIELAFGKQVAQQYALQQQGFDRETARRLAGMMAAMEGSDGATGASMSGPSALAAKESRLLTRGRNEEQQKTIAKNTRMTAEAAREQLRELRELATAMRNNPALRVALASA